MSETLVITVSGSCAGAGKTRLIELLIPYLRNCAAIKARTEEGAEFSVVAEGAPASASGKDTGRFLSAGAMRAYLITGATARVLGAVEEIIAGGEFDVVVVESNRIAMELEAGLALYVKGRGEPKPGAERCEAQADVIVIGVSGKEGMPVPSPFPSPGGRGEGEGRSSAGPSPVS